MTSPQPPDRRRNRLASWTFRNMVLSVLGVLAFALVWWSITYQPDQQQGRPVQVAPVASYAAAQAQWPVWVAAPGEGWKPTVVWFDPVAERPTWHTSFVSPQGRYVAIHQVADATDDWLAEVLPEARRDGDVTLTGPDGRERTWQRWVGPKDGNAQVGYVLGPEETGGSTVALHGTAEQAEFEELLASVTPRD